MTAFPIAERRERLDMRVGAQACVFAQLLKCVAPFTARRRLGRHDRALLGEPYQSAEAVLGQPKLLGGEEPEMSGRGELGGQSRLMLQLFGRGDGGKRLGRDLAVIAPLDFEPESCGV